MPKKPLNPDVELIRLEALCNRAEHCSYEIAEKLRRKGYTSFQASQLIETLKKGRFIDDRRFAAAYVHDKYAFSGWGRLKIRNGLMAKRVPSEIITEAMEQEIDSREYTVMAYRAIRAKLRTLPPDMPRPDARNRLMRFGASRGYEAGLILKILSSERLWTSVD